MARARERRSLLQGNFAEPDAIRFHVELQLEHVQDRVADDPLIAQHNITKSGGSEGLGMERFDQQAERIAPTWPTATLPALQASQEVEGGGQP